MKKIIILLFLAVFSALSCSRLDENPTTMVSEKAIFSTKEGLETAMTGCYSTLKGSNLWQARMMEFLQCGSLLVHWSKYRTQESWTQCLDMTMYSNDTYNEGAFNQSYEAINACNTFIQNLSDSPVEESYKLELEGEAKLIRAIFYWHMVRMWGDVPLVTSKITSLQDANLPRSSYILVYKQILDDLTFAEENMRDRERQRSINGLSERADNWAATAFKACVYDQIGCILSSPDDQPFREKPDFSPCGIDSEQEAWQFALIAAESVIKYSPYKLCEKYGDLFRWTDPEDYMVSEKIFTIPSCDMTYACTNMWTLPNYMEGTAHTTATAGNWGRIRPARFVFQKWAATYGGELGIGRKDGLTDIYVNCKDPRFDLTYIYNLYFNQNTRKNTGIYPYDGIVKGTDMENSKSWTQFAPYFRKYLNPRYNANNGFADFYMLRLAEIYLVAAEASAGLSESVGDSRWQDAMAYIEVLHARARHSVSDGYPDSAYPKWEADRFSTKEELETAIFWERIFELSGEGHEWFDMRRRGANWVIKNITVPVNAFMQQPAQGPSETSGDKSLFTTGYFSRVFPTQPGEMLKSLLCAFPECEILNNSAIGPEDQNPYFIK